MTQPAPASYIKAIHAAARAAGLDEDTRRDFIQRETGKRSSKDLDRREAVRVIEGLKALAPKSAAAPKRKAKGALDLDGRFVPKVRALWIAGYHLGVVRDRTDAAMVSFVLRQTGVDHARWASKAIEDPAAANRVIEGLKAWIARVADVGWVDEDPDSLGAKRAVYLAIRRALTAAGVDPQFNEFPGRMFAPKDAAGLDELTRLAGARLRQARAGGA